VKKHVGEILVNQGTIDRIQLEDALERQRKTGEKLGRLLIKLGYLSEEELGTALSEQINIPHIDLSSEEIDPAVINLIPEKVARKYDLIPVRREGNNIVVAMDDPLNSIAMELLTFTAGMRIVPVLAGRTQIRKALEMYYTKKQVTSESLLQYFDEDLVIAQDADLSEQKLRYESKTAVNIKSVNMLLIEGIRRGASDIHIEMDNGISRARYRVDGLLQEAFIFKLEQHTGMVARIKVLANMNLTERRLPQDGAFRIEYEGKHVDMRISTIPMIQGENVVIRILVQDTMKFDIESLGFSDWAIDVIKAACKNPSGLIITTGPTGSGKSTTLYSILRMINSLDKKILTVEDPVEYRFPLINQMTVRPSIGLDFASSLRAILRHDPDIILVGEMRDSETAEICIRAALTGHLVLSTLHTRSGVDSAIRLVDMGIEHYLIADTIDLVISQRLMRQLCPECKKKVIFDVGGRQIETYQAVGCPACNSGYSGRIGIYEVIPGDVMRPYLIANELDSAKMQEAVREADIPGLWEEGLRMVRLGKTSLEELRRVLPANFAKFSTGKKANNHE